jgi:hypothetical protein
MIDVKYFDPKIDRQSLLACYDYDYVAKVKDLLGVTDYWVTYSWGFSDETEQEDREFQETGHSGTRIHSGPKSGL